MYRIQVSLPIHEPLALIEAATHFTIQLLLAQHPDILLPQEQPSRHQRTPELRILAALRDLHDALEDYATSYPPEPPDDFIPF